MVVISLVAMLGIVGLALDGGHSMLNKSRLQNVVDASALDAAYILDLSDGDTDLARAEALGSSFPILWILSCRAPLRRSTCGSSPEVWIFPPGSSP
jgi:hypothetical protein